MFLGLYMIAAIVFVFSGLIVTTNKEREDSISYKIFDVIFVCSYQSFALIGIAQGISLIYYDLSH